MDHITQADVYDLINRVPSSKLPVAYSMLEALIDDDAGLLPAQLEYLRLPLPERRQHLVEQAQKMVTHYEQTAAERQSWQAGDFNDD